MIQIRLRIRSRSKSERRHAVTSSGSRTLHTGNMPLCATDTKSSAAALYLKEEELLNALASAPTKRKVKERRVRNMKKGKTEKSIEVTMLTRTGPRSGPWTISFVPKEKSLRVEAVR